MKRKRIGERGFVKRLARLLERALRRGGRVETFEDLGVLTNNRGLVVTLLNKQVIELTIVEDRRR